MTIYLDAAFAVNAAVDYLLLAASARVSGAPLRRGRLALAALGGGLFAAAAFCLPVLRLWPVKLLAAAAMLAAAFGVGWRLLRQGAVFALVSLAFAGLVLALCPALGVPLTVLHGTAYYGLSFPALLLAAGGAYLAAEFLLQRTARHGGGQIARLTVRAGGRTAGFTALRDSGNTLCDPADNTQVLVVQWQAVRSLLPASFRQDWCEEPVRAFQTLVALAPQLHWRLIAYRAVGTQGMLLAFKPEQVEVDGKPAGHMTVALSPTPVSDGGGYMGLLGGEV